MTDLPTQLSTDAGHLILLLVRGGKPYLWIGRLGPNGEEYLDSIDVAKLKRALAKIPEPS